jgi:hypothetical protein
MNADRRVLPLINTDDTDLNKRAAMVKAERFWLLRNGESRALIPAEAKAQVDI